MYWPGEPFHLELSILGLPRHIHFRKMDIISYEQYKQNVDITKTLSDI